MRQRNLDGALLITSLSTLLLGFTYQYFWAVAGAIGLIPATIWLVNDIRKKTMGSDVLVVLSLISTLFTDY